MRKMIIRVAGAMLSASVGLAPAACAGSQSPGDASSADEQTLGEARTSSAEPAPPTSDATATTTSAAAASPVLPDGLHPGYVKSLSGDFRSMKFDLVEWYTGDAAIEAYHEDCNCDAGVDDGYYVRNNNPMLRTLAISPSVIVIIVGGPTGGDSSMTEEIPLSHLADQWQGDLALHMVWLTIDNGVVTKIEQQWVP